MKITCTAYSSVNKITAVLCVYSKAVCVSNIGLDECDVQKAGFSCFQTVTDCLLKLVGYPEHCVYSERVCYRPNLCRPIKWYDSPETV